MSNNKHYSQFVSVTEKDYAEASKLKKAHGMISLAIPNKVHGREREREINRKRENKSEPSNK